MNSKLLDWNNSAIIGVFSDTESKDIFTFKWTDPKTGQKQQYRWTVLPQGFTESLNLFGQVLQQILKQFQPLEGVLPLQYVDDLLLSGQDKTVVKEATNELFDFLGKQGLKVLENKFHRKRSQIFRASSVRGGMKNKSREGSGNF